MQYKSHQLRLGRWKFIAFSLLPVRFQLSLSSTRPVFWLRIGLIPGLGSFHNKKSTFLFLGFLVVKSYENRTMTVTPHGQNPDYEEVDVDYSHKKVNNPDMVSKRNSQNNNYVLSFITMVSSSFLI